MADLVKVEVMNDIPRHAHLERIKSIVETARFTSHNYLLSVLEDTLSTSLASEMIATAVQDGYIKRLEFRIRSINYTGILYFPIDTTFS